MNTNITTSDAPTVVLTAASERTTVSCAPMTEVTSVIAHSGSASLWRTSPSR